MWKKILTLGIPCLIREISEKIKERKLKREEKKIKEMQTKINKLHDKLEYRKAVSRERLKQRDASFQRYIHNDAANN